jgi:hypothetical protein
MFPALTLRLYERERLCATSVSLRFMRRQPGPERLASAGREQTLRETFLFALRPMTRANSDLVHAEASQDLKRPRRQRQQSQPSAVTEASSTILARFAGPDGTLGSRASSPSLVRSPSRSTSAGAKDMLHCLP